MTRRHTEVAIGFLIGLSISAFGWADPVIDWNNATLDAIRAMHVNPPRATRTLAMVHIAIFDAVNGIAGDCAPYHITRPGPPGASVEAAAATAAYEVLQALYPGLQPSLSQHYSASLATIPDGPAKAKGQSYGSFVAKRIVKLRSQDGSDSVAAYTPSGQFGRWQPTPRYFAPALLPNWPQVTPFALASTAQCQAPAPPAFDSPAYAAVFNEVRAYGGVKSTARTPDETLIAYFWEDGPGTVTPPGHWQLIAQQLSKQYRLTLGDNARLFALLSLTQADAAICAWSNKFRWDHPRPYTAITPSPPTPPATAPSAAAPPACSRASSAPTLSPFAMTRPMPGAGRRSPA